MTYGTRSSLGEEELILACFQSSFIQLKELNPTSDECRVDKYKSKMITFSFKRQKITNLQMQIQTRSNKCWYLSLTAYAPGKFSRFEGRNMLKPSAAVAINKSFICGCQWPSFKSFCPCKSEQTLNEPMPQHQKPQKVLQLLLSSHRLTS